MIVRIVETHENWEEIFVEIFGVLFDGVEDSEEVELVVRLTQFGPVFIVSERVHFSFFEFFGC